MSWLANLLQRPDFDWWDLLDILIVSVVVYELLKLIRGTRAVQMAIGIAVIVALFYISLGLQLETLNWLIRNVVGYVVFAAIVLLQADIRRALMHLGRAPVFRRFERAVSSQNYGGLGLGLFIANEIIEAHGGTIEVTSEPDRGSEFTVLLPTGITARRRLASAQPPARSLQS